MTDEEYALEMGDPRFIGVEIDRVQRGLAFGIYSNPQAQIAYLKRLVSRKAYLDNIRRNGVPDTRAGCATPNARAEQPGPGTEGGADG